jgi:2-oxoisovalerate dehydrogenase E1 component beta subunit
MSVEAGTTPTTDPTAVDVDTSTATSANNDAPAPASVTMTKALNQALRDSLADDDTVLVFGEDVGRLGGVFRVTEGLRAEFGSNRVWDSPLAESGIIGTAIGMAMNGMRPVVEMQFDAYAYPAFEQIVSHVAKMRNRTKGRISLPITIRIPYAGDIGGVEHHSDSSEAYWTSTPGLTVVTPSNPADAYSLLRESIASDDPVVFMEPKSRYWMKETLSLPVTTAPMDRAQVIREGTDVTSARLRPDRAHGPGFRRGRRRARTVHRGHRPAHALPLRR